MPPPPPPPLAVSLQVRDAILPAWVTTVTALQQYLDFDCHTLRATVGAKDFRWDTSVFHWIQSLRRFAVEPTQRLDVDLFYSGDWFHALRQGPWCYVAIWSGDEQRPYYIGTTEDELVDVHDGLVRQMLAIVDPDRFIERDALEGLMIRRPGD